MAHAISFLQAILGFLLILGPLIFLHELGHFLVAKWMDIKVVRFSLGFPPKAFGIKWGETEYCVSWVPWGGYVKMGGDTPGEPVDDPRSYLAKPVWMRLPVVLAGVVMNFLTAWVVLTYLAATGAEYETTTALVRVAETSVGYTAGLRSGDLVKSVNGKPVAHFAALANEVRDAYERRASDALRLDVEREGKPISVSYHPVVKVRQGFADFGFDEYLLPVIGNVTHGFPAYQAGVRAGDKIVSVNGKKVEWFTDLADTIHKSIGVPVDLEIERGGKILKVSLVPSPQVISGQRIGMIGIQPPYTMKDRSSVPLKDAVDRGLYGSVRLAGGTVDVVVNLFKGKQDVTTTLGGPIAIAAAAGNALRGGLQKMLELIAQLSIGLAILNVLPLAPLDGGHIFMLIAEAIRRRPLPMKAQVVIQNAGFLLVMGLMLVIVYSDIHKVVARQFFPQIH